MTEASHTRPRSRAWAAAKDFLPLAVVFAVLFGVSFLPPDTSLSEVDRLGRLSVCMPTRYPPLVTGDPERPGFEVELLEKIADRLGWRLNTVSNSAMGRDFNPRAWRINRAQCQMLAGGIALNATTRSFLDTSDPHLLTGWAYAAAPGTDFTRIAGPVGFLAGLTGLDRIALGQYLRERGIPARIVNGADALRAGLEAGDFDVAVTEALLAQQTFADTEYAVDFLPAALERFPLGFGFWKGDMTLKRAVEATVETLWDEGFIGGLAQRYGLDPELLCHPQADAC